MSRIVINASRHNLPHIPNQNPLIPPTSRTPALRAKKTPIHAGRKLGVPSHATELSAAAQRQRIGRSLGTGHTDGAAVGPHAARHVVAGGQQHVAEVRAPGQLAHGELVARQHRQRAAGRRPHVEHPDHPVHARRRHDAVAVLVPVVRQRFGGCCGYAWCEAGPCCGRAVDRDLRREVVRGGRLRAQVEDAQLRV